MNGRDPYETWKDARSAVDTGETFTAGVMAKVRASGDGRRQPEGMTRRLVAAGLVAAALAIAFAQIAWMGAFVLGISERGF